MKKVFKYLFEDRINWWQIIWIGWAISIPWDSLKHFGESFLIIVAGVLTEFLFAYLYDL